MIGTVKWFSPEQGQGVHRGRDPTRLGAAAAAGEAAGGRPLPRSGQSMTATGWPLTVAAGSPGRSGRVIGVPRG